MLSLFLFVMGMEALSILLRKAMVGGFIFGCKLRGSEGEDINFSPLLLVDDTIVVYKASKE